MYCRIVTGCLDGKVSTLLTRRLSRGARKSTTHDFAQAIIEYLLTHLFLHSFIFKKIFSRSYQHYLYILWVYIYLEDFLPELSILFVYFVGFISTSKFFSRSYQYYLYILLGFYLPRSYQYYLYILLGFYLPRRFSPGAINIICIFCLLGFYLPPL